MGIGPAPRSSRPLMAALAFTCAYFLAVAPPDRDIAIVRAHPHLRRAAGADRPLDPRALDRTHRAQVRRGLDLAVDGASAELAIEISEQAQIDMAIGRGRRQRRSPGAQADIDRAIGIGKQALVAQLGDSGADIAVLGAELDRALATVDRQVAMGALSR